MYRIYLDNVLIADEPIGLSDIEITIERNSVLRGLLSSFTSELTFIGDGYDALIAKRDDSITSLTNVLIQYFEDGIWNDLYEGIIFTSDISFNLTKKKATVPIQDNSFGARIANNKNIKASLDIGKSKNGDAIAAVTTVALDFYNPVDAVGTYFFPDIKCYRVYDCFRFLIDFMTDGNVDFDSTFFNTGGTGEGYVVTTGKILSGTDDDDSLFISFEDLFNELDYRFNLAFRVDTSGATPKVVIEPSNDFYVDDDSVTLSSPMDIIQNFDKERLYSVVEFGNNIYTQYNSLDNANYPTISFFGHRSESFHVLGESNVDNTLSLEGTWSVDSNSIEQAVVGTSGTTTATTGFKLVDGGAGFTNGDVAVGQNVYNLTDGTSTTVSAIDSATQLSLAADIFTSGEDYKIATRTTFDDAIFIVQTDYPTNSRATKNDDFEPALSVYLYNVLLNNYNVSVNYFAGIHDSIASYLYDDTENARAAITSSSGLSYSGLSTSIVLWDDDSVNGYDTGGNYTPANGRYTVPAGGSGAYQVGAVFDYAVSSSSFLQAIAECYIRQYNSGGTLLRELKIETFTEGIPPILWGGGTGTFYANDGDYFRIEIDWLLAGTVYIKQLSGFSLIPYSSFNISQISSGDIVQTYNPDDFRGFLYEFDYPISGANWNSINAAVTKRIAFTDGSTTYKGWIQKLVYRHSRKLASLSLSNTE